MQLDPRGGQCTCYVVPHLLKGDPQGNSLTCCPGRWGRSKDTRHGKPCGVEALGKSPYCWAGLVRLCRLDVPREQGDPRPPTPTASHMMPSRGGTTVLSLNKSSSICLSTPVYSPPSLGPRGTTVQTHLHPRTARALPSGLTRSQLTCREGSLGHPHPILGLGHHHPSPILSHAGLIPPPASGSRTQRTQAFFQSHHVTQFRPKTIRLGTCLFLVEEKKLFFPKVGSWEPPSCLNSLSQHRKKQS